MIKILLFYKYEHIEYPEKVYNCQRALLARLGFKGRSIIASEGLNITLEGEEESISAYIKEVEQDPRFQNIHWKISEGTGSAFPRLSVKVRPEIVTGKLGVCDIDPNQVTGIHLKPEELHAWIHESKEFYIVDMRNAYEHRVGHFAGSILPRMDNFRDLARITKEISHLKDKTVLTVCTGGVRCEKASGFLITQGFKDVYQLDGGIVSYMEKYPNEDFRGKLYVFDNRITMGFYTDDAKHEVIGRCDFCNTPCDRYRNCIDNFCHKHLITCEDCEERVKGEVKCPTGCHETRHGKKKAVSGVNFLSRIFNSFKSNK